jgi:hypothetical protein
MGKRNTAAQLPESKLIKAMAELKDAVAKGDALEEQDPEGDLAAEGEPLSSAARGNKGVTKKSRAADDAESEVEKSDDDSSSDGGDDESEISKMLSCSGGDDASSDAPPPFAKKKDKAKKSVRKAAASTASSDDDSSDDDSSTSKSFRAQAENDEQLAKAIEISPFLEALIDNFSVAMKRMTTNVAKSITEMEMRLNARIDNRVAKGVSVQSDFNARMAKAVTAIGESVQGDVVDMIKSLANSPAPITRGKAVLSKSEVNNPPWAGAQQSDNRMADGSGGDYLAECAEFSSDAIGNWLFNKSCKNEIDSKLILAWEADRYNPEALPVQVRKALVNDLSK